MELYDQDFLDELMALRRETWETNPNTEENQFFSNGFSFDSFDQNSLGYLPNSSQVPQSYNNDYTFNEIYGSLLEESSSSAPPQVMDSYYNYSLDTPFNIPPCPLPEDFPLSMMEEEDPGLLGEELQNMELQTTCKMEPATQSPEPEMPVFNMGGVGLERKNRAKKVQGQPSKNLMAERRRRKRLNDRLSMLRAIVPKISKVRSEDHSLLSAISTII